MKTTTVNSVTISEILNLIDWQSNQISDMAENEMTTKEKVAVIKELNKRLKRLNEILDFDVNYTDFGKYLWLN